MNLPIGRLIEAAWLVFLLYWSLSAPRVKGAQRSEPLASRLLKYWLPLAAAVLLIQPVRGYPSSFLHLRVVPESAALLLLGLLLTWLGVALAIRARMVLGRNWSSEVQVKHDHELVVRGPYRWVRHPIYTGLLLAVLGSALALGELRGAIAFAIIAASFWFKLRLEERWMAEQFGRAYDDYMRRTKALVPGLL